MGREKWRGGYKNYVKEFEKRKWREGVVVPFVKKNERKERRITEGFDGI